MLIAFLAARNDSNVSHLHLQAGEVAEGDEEAERKLERMGLTPDWIIQVVLFCFSQHN